MTTESSTAPVEAGFKNRRVGLIVFGILQILLGVGCMGLLGLTVLASVLSGGGAAAFQAAGQRTLLGSLLFYGALGVWFVWMGIGSVAARRWARALTLVFSWLWLVTGVAGFGSMVWIVPELVDQMARQGGMPPMALTVMRMSMIGTSLLCYVLLPALLVSFYQSKHVWATVQRLDPQPRWTDQCPLPVLALCVACGMGAGSFLLAGFSWPALPVFGRVLTGGAGAALAVATAGLLVYLARACYRVRPHGWWGLWLLSSGWGASVLVSLGQTGLGEFYHRLPMAGEQRELVEALAPRLEPWMVVWTGVGLAVVLGYLLGVRRFFQRA